MACQSIVQQGTITQQAMSKALAQKEDPAELQEKVYVNYQKILEDAELSRALKNKIYANFRENNLSFKQYFSKEEKAAIDDLIKKECGAYFSEKRPFWFPSNMKQLSFVKGYCIAHLHISFLDYIDVTLFSEFEKLTWVESLQISLHTAYDVERDAWLEALKSLPASIRVITEIKDQSECEIMDKKMRDDEIIHGGSACPLQYFNSWTKETWPEENNKIKSEDRKRWIGIWQSLPNLKILTMDIDNLREGIFPYPDYSGYA